MTRGYLLCALLGGIAYQVAGPVAAAGAQASRARAAAVSDESYADLIREAVREFDAGNFVEARTLFERAHAQRPSARTLRGLGFCSYELKHYVQAATELEAALAESVNPLTAAQRAEVSATARKARRFIGTLVLDVTPQTASVEVDGRAVDTRELELDAGDHTVSATAAGFHDTAQTITLEGGQTSSARLRLAALALSPRVAAETSVRDAEQTATPAREERAGHSLLTRWWFWTAVGVVVAGAAVGTALALRGENTTATPYQGSTGIALRVP